MGKEARPPIGSKFQPLASQSQSCSFGCSHFELEHFIRVHVPTSVLYNFYPPYDIYKYLVTVQYDTYGMLS